MSKLADISCFESLQNHANYLMLSGMACFNESSSTLNSSDFVVNDSDFVSVFNIVTLAEPTIAQYSTAYQAMKMKLKPVNDLTRLAVILDMLADNASVEYESNGRKFNSKSILKTRANNIKSLLDRVNATTEVTKQIKYLQELVKSGYIDLKKADGLKLPITTQDRSKLGLVYRYGSYDKEQTGSRKIQVIASV